MDQAGQVCRDQDPSSDKVAASKSSLRAGSQVADRELTCGPRGRAETTTLCGRSAAEEEAEKYEDASATSASTSASNASPSKRNKRKMTEPRKRRTDFSIRSLCSNSDDDDNDEDDDDDNDDDDDGTRENEMEKREEETGSGRKRKRVPDDDKDPVVSSSRRAANTIRNNSVATGSSTSSSFPPAGYSYIPMSSAAAAAMVFQASSSLSSLLTPFLLNSSGTVPLSAPTAAATRLSPDEHSGSTTDMRCSGFLSPPPRFDGSGSPSSPPLPVDVCLSTGHLPPARRARKNYKNMTKQRRIEANARERTRVHTISAAFESLRRAVPSYSYNQRLSKLAILRIACSYILALARLAELDYSEEQRAMTFGECVDLCTQTIQAEGKAKRRH